MPDKDGPNVTRPIGYKFPETVPLVFANHFVIRQTEHEAILHFYLLDEPVVVGNKEQVEKQLADFKEVEASCVARIAIAGSRLPDILSAITRNVAKRQEHATPGDEEKPDDNGDT